MRVRAAIACAVLGAGLAGWVGAQESSAPLSETKQQLKALQKDRAAQQSGMAAGKLSDALPGSGALPQITTPEAPPPRPPERTDEAKQKRAGQNWLLDGVNELSRTKSDRNARTATGRRGETEEDTAAGAAPLDPADPDYFLRVYERERAAQLARREEQQLAAQAAGGSAAGTAQPNAMAPFLEQWLAGSPVRDIVREGANLNRRATPAGGGELTRSGAPESAPSDPRPAFEIADRVAPVAATPARSDTNPFLQALGLSTAPVGPSAARNSSTVLPPPPAPARAAESTVLPAPTPEPLRRPPNVTDESRKYFPQLKKF